MQIASGYGKCEAVVESTANMWIKIYDTVEISGINTVLTNQNNCEVKAKSDKLDARMLAALLSSGLIY